MRSLLTLLVLATLGYGGFLGYQRWQASRDPTDVAHAAMSDQDYQAAIGLLENARRAHPSDQMLIVDLAECYYRVGDKTRASACYNSVMDLVNDPSRALEMRHHRANIAGLHGAGF